MERLLHTPEGVRDIYNEECEKKLAIQEEMHQVLKSYGYRDIETPMFEYFDVFSKDVGTTPSRELYKFFDREGNTLVLRPDMTPSIARAVSRYFKEEHKTIRLCYVGKTFINHSSYQGRLKETTQLGAEFIGSDSVWADAEIIAMVADCLKASGLEEFQISIGQVDYVKSILKELSLDEETEEKLKDYISNRNLFGVEQLLEPLSIKEDVRHVLLSLPELYGSVTILDRAEELAVNEESVNAISRLKELYRILKNYGITRYVSFDLSMLGRYDYYTGIFFRGYTFGTGDAVVKGGRYDNLLRHFGKDAPSIGFVVVVDQLMAALMRQKIGTEETACVQQLFYTKEQQGMAIHLAGRMRMQGICVALDCVEAEDFFKTKTLLQLCKKYNIEE